MILWYNQHILNFLVERTHCKENLWERRYLPRWLDGKKHVRTVYAVTETERDEELVVMVAKIHEGSLRSMCHVLKHL